MVKCGGREKTRMRELAKIFSKITKRAVLELLPLRFFFSSPHRLILALVSLAILSAVILPVQLLAGRRFHHDEALYATWALEIVSGADPWLTHTPIDKPPLFLYLIAGVMGWLGVTETVARLPSLVATACTVGLTFALGRKLYGNGVGVVAAWLVALSPFTLLFAPTTFTDPLLVAWVLVSCLAAAYGRTGWAGMSLGLAMTTKQQGIFFLPVVIALLTIYDLRFTIYDLRSMFPAFRFPLPAPRSPLSTFRFPLSAFRFTLALLVTLMPILIWNFNRSQAPDFLTRSLANYGGLAADTTSFGEHWWDFIELLYYGTASPVLNGIFVVGLPVLLGYGLWNSKPTADHRPQTAGNTTTDGSTELTEVRRVRSLPVGPPSAKPPRGTADNFQPSNFPTFQPFADWLFTLFTFTFLLGHALFSFQVWDRYLLGLIPFLALLLARILLLAWSLLERLWLHTRPGWQQPASIIYGLALAGLLALTLARPVQDAVNGRYPLGSHSQAFQGLEQIVAYLQGHAGANHTLYHRWLGAHWRFYLWGYPYDLQYWASPQELAATARPGHLIAFPSWQSDTEARLALAKAGLTLQELTRAYNPAGYPSIILYKIVPGRSQE